MANTTLTQLPANIQGFYDRLLLTRPEEMLVMDRFGQARTLPANSGTKINFRRYSNLAPAGVLTEGVTPAGSQLSATDISATVLQYGDFVTLTDQIEMHGLDNTVASAVEILSYQMAETVETAHRDAIVPNLANKVFIASNEAATVAGDIITGAAIKAAILQLKSQNAMKFTPMVGATSATGTTPVRAAYWGVIHPDVVFDLEDQAGFISAEHYASTKTLTDGEVGAYKDVRFVETNKAYVNADGGALAVDTYHTAIFGKECYGIVSVRGKGNGSVIVKPLGSGDDALNQRSTVGFKVSTVAKILNDQFGVSIVSASSQGAN